MPNGRFKREYPEKKIILELAAKLGSKAKVAQSLGVPKTSLKDHLTREGLDEAFNTACRKATKPAVLPPLVNEEVVHEHEVAMLKQEIRELRTALNSTSNEDVRTERVRQTIQAAVEAKAPRFKAKNFPVTQGGSKKQPHTLALLWSDLHGGEVVSSEETNGANEYNWKIMLERHNELRRGVLSFADRFGPVEELVILGLGDMLSGDIHDELAETNEMHLSDAVVQLGLDGAEFVESFTDMFPVRFAGVTGNHGRFSHKPRSKGRYHNADWLCYSIMQQRLSKVANIKFEVPKAARHPVEIYNKRLLLLHGDGVRSTMQGVPWGGIIRHTNLLSNQYASLGMPIDHFCAGHYHEANVISNRKILMNGSIKGIDEYSLDRFGGGHGASQLLASFHPQWGLAGVHFIDLEPSGN